MGYHAYIGTMEVDMTYTGKARLFTVDCNPGVLPDLSGHTRVKALSADVKLANVALKEIGSRRRIAVRKFGRWGKGNPNYRRGMSCVPMKFATRYDVYLGSSTDYTQESKPWDRYELYAVLTKFLRAKHADPAPKPKRVRKPRVKSVLVPVADYNQPHVGW